MENNKNNSDDNKPRSPRFNSFWIYGVIALFLLALNIYTMSEGTKEQVSMNRLEDMITSGDVEKLVVLNERYAHIYIKAVGKKAIG